MANEENKKKVLVVDDDENLRTVLLDKLNLSGFEAIGAVNGKEGLEKALKLHPDIILLDVLMPIMSGWETLGNLRKDEWGKKAKVMMLTVIEDAESIAQAVEGQSVAYLLKTEETMDEVVEKVKEMIKISEAQNI